MLLVSPESLDESWRFVWADSRDRESAQWMLTQVQAVGVWTPLVVSLSEQGPILLDGYRRLDAVLDLLSQGITQSRKGKDLLPLRAKIYTGNPEPTFLHAEVIRLRLSQGREPRGAKTQVLCDLLYQEHLRAQAEGDYPLASNWLARLCGVNQSHLSQIRRDWQAQNPELAFDRFLGEDGKVRRALLKD